MLKTIDKNFKKNKQEKEGDKKEKITDYTGNYIEGFAKKALLIETQKTKQMKK